MRDPSKFTWSKRSWSCWVLALILSILLALSCSRPLASWTELVGKPSHLISFFSLLIIFMAIRTLRASYTLRLMFFWSYCWSVGEVHLESRKVKINEWMNEWMNEWIYNLILSILKLTKLINQSTNQVNAHALMKSINLLIYTFKSINIIYQSNQSIDLQIKLIGKQIE